MYDEDDEMPNHTMTDKQIELNQMAMGADSDVRTFYNSCRNGGMSEKILPERGQSRYQSIRNLVENENVEITPKMIEYAKSSNEKYGGNERVVKFLEENYKLQNGEVVEPKKDKAANLLQIIGESKSAESTKRSPTKKM